MSLIEFENENDYTATIKVVGVGGGGTNAVNSMVRDNLLGVEFIIANTDLQSLEKSACPGKIQIGGELTRFGGRFEPRNRKRCRAGKQKYNTRYA